MSDDQPNTNPSHNRLNNEEPRRPHHIASIDNTVSNADSNAPQGGSPAESSSAPSSVRVEGLAETLQDVRHELQLISYATKFNWINQRLILLRNALIALSVLAVVVVTAVATYREAYRQTLTVAAFGVPDSLAKRGITGQVVAKALFDELIKRRDLVTTLDPGELKGA